MDAEERDLTPVELPAMKEGVVVLPAGYMVMSRVLGRAEFLSFAALVGSCFHSVKYGLIVGLGLILSGIVR